MTLPETSPFPVLPTTVPQARKYTREFKAAAGKVFTEEDSIVIEIPPIANTYLTKDARIHFKFDLSFYDHSFTSADDAQLNAIGWWTNTNVNNKPTTDVFNVSRKPVPMLESSGPYAFFRDVEVYDYLGNTLLEKVNRHDLLACVLADFYLDSELDRIRPRISESNSAHSVLMFNPTTLTPVTFGSTFSLPSMESRVNGVNLLDPENQELLTGDGLTDFYTYVTTAPQKTSQLVVAPTLEFSIRLLNFLGRGSSNFVPLHNGYRIVLKTNPANVAVQFGLPSGSLTVPTGTSSSVTIVPQINSYNFSDVRLRADLLEITPELDAQVDKSVHCRMNSYVTLGRCEQPTIIPGNFLSVNNIRLSMRQMPMVKENFSVMGFRSRTYVIKARLTYNDAVQQEYTSPGQMRIALGPEFDPSISVHAFTTDQPGIDIHGTGGYLYPYYSPAFRGQIASTANPTGFSWFQKNNNNPFFSRYNDQAGKFLIQFDLSLNGYHQNTITGIDTTKTTLRVELDRSYVQAEPYETDVFIDHDAIITIKPGQYSTVSF